MATDSNDIFGILFYPVLARYYLTVLTSWHMWRAKPVLPDVYCLIQPWRN